jgi:WD40 repeat protein
MSGVKSYHKKLRTKYGLEDVSARLVKVLDGHTGPVTSIAFSFDGRFVLSGSYDKTVRSWDPNTGQCRIFSKDPRMEAFPPSSSISRIAGFYDRPYLISASDDKLVNVWDVGAGTTVWHKFMQYAPVNNASFTSLCVSSRGDLFAAGYENGVVTLHPPGFEMRTVPDSPGAASLKKDDPLYEQALQTGSAVTALRFSPDGEYLCVGNLSSPPSILRRRPDTFQYEGGMDLLISKFDNTATRDLCFSSDGTLLAQAMSLKQSIGEYGQFIVLWRTESLHTNNRSAKLLGALASGPLTSICFSPSNRLVVGGSSDGTVRIWDLETHECAKEFQAHEKSVMSVAYSPVEDLFATSSYDKTIKLWEVKVA